MTSGGGMVWLQTTAPRDGANRYLYPDDSSPSKDSIWFFVSQAFMPWSRYVTEDTALGQTGFGRRAVRYTVTKAGDLVGQQNFRFTLSSLSNYIAVTTTLAAPLPAGTGPWTALGGAIRWKRCVGISAFPEYRLMFGAVPVDNVFAPHAFLNYHTSTTDEGTALTQCHPKIDEAVGDFSSDPLVQAEWSYADRRIVTPLLFDHATGGFGKFGNLIGAYATDMIVVANFETFANLIAFEGGAGIFSPTYVPAAGEDFYSIAAAGTGPDIAPILHSTMIGLTTQERQVFQNFQGEVPFVQKVQLIDRMVKNPATAILTFVIQPIHPTRRLSVVVERDYHGTNAVVAAGNSIPNITAGGSWNYERHCVNAKTVAPAIALSPLGVVPFFHQVDMVNEIGFQLNGLVLIPDNNPAFDLRCIEPAFAVKNITALKAEDRRIQPVFYAIDFDVDPTQNEVLRGEFNPSHLDTVRLRLTFNAAGYLSEQASERLFVSIYQERINVLMCNKGLRGVAFG